jgi:predicted GIY-YIG superfamily endonuclease
MNSILFWPQLFSIKSAIIFLAHMSIARALIHYRSVKSKAMDIPLYNVFCDNALERLIHTRPRTIGDLTKIKGFDQQRCNAYGQDLLRLFDNFSIYEDAPRPRSTVVLHANRRLKRTGVGNFLTKAIAPRDEDRIYVLELDKGRVYVGRSKNVARRVQQHKDGVGPSFTAMYPPTGVLLPRLGRVSGSAEAAERDETLRYMHLRGIDKVRGWKYTNVLLTEAEVREIKDNIREMLNLCRRCGHPGHFAAQCKNNFDTDGNQLPSR